MTLRVIDTESTGFDPATSHLIQVASIDLTPDGGFTNPMETLVRLPDGAVVPPEASAIHHIIAEDLADALPLGQAVFGFLNSDYYIAHHAEHDIKFLPMIKPPAQWICTHKCALRLWPDAPDHKNQTLRYWLGIKEPFGIAREKINAHDAMSDVYVTGAVFQRMLKEAKFTQLLQWSAEDYLYPRWTWSKNFGKRVSETDAGFLTWVIEKSDRKDWHHTCKTELARRREAQAA